MALTRRTLFEAAGAAALGFAAIAGSRFACRFVPRNHPDFFSLLDGAPADRAAMRIGRLALAQAAAPANLASLETTLRARPLLESAVGTACPRTRGDLVRLQCAEDFRDGRVVVLDGWMLSETEAAICAAKVLTTVA